MILTPDEVNKYLDRGLSPDTILKAQDFMDARQAVSCYNLADIGSGQARLMWRDLTMQVQVEIFNIPGWMPDMPEKVWGQYTEDAPEFHEKKPEVLIFES